MDLLRYKANGSAVMTDTSFVRARGVVGRCGASPLLSMVRRPSATVVSGAIRAVTLADVNRVIRRLFNPDAFTFVVVGQPEGLGQ